MKRLWAIGLTGVAGLAIAGYFLWPKTAPVPSINQNVSPAVTTAERLLAVGDIADCSKSGDEQTFALVENLNGTVLTLGDNVYPKGTIKTFNDCYAPNWGKLLDRTYPVPGNHDYEDPGAAGYFEYFGLRAGDRDQGYYSFELGAWHLIVLNSNCGEIGGCGPGSKQMDWLQQDLTAHANACTLAALHHPPFSSGLHGTTAAVREIWNVLDGAGVDVVLAGHDHSYERFVPMGADGKPSENGPRLFVVGTGGESHYPFIRPPLATSLVRNSTAFGVLELLLDPDGYSWVFLPVAGADFSDAGSANCQT